MLERRIAQRPLELLALGLARRRVALGLRERRLVELAQRLPERIAHFRRALTDRERRVQIAPRGFPFAQRQMPAPERIARRSLSDGPELRHPYLEILHASAHAIALA